MKRFLTLLFLFVFGLSSSFALFLSPAPDSGECSCGEDEDGICLPCPEDPED